MKTDRGHTDRPHFSRLEYDKMGRFRGFTAAPVSPERTAALREERDRFVAGILKGIQRLAT